MTVTTTFSLTNLQAEAQGNGYTAGTQFGSDVIGLANDGYAVAYGNPDATFGAFSAVSLRNAAFVAGATNGPHGPGGIDMQGDPAMVRLASGNIAIVWDEGLGSAGQPGSNEIVGAILNPVTGAVIHAEFIASPFDTDRDPEVAALNNGNWVVAMSNIGLDDIYLQLMSPTGARINVAQIETGTSANDTNPVIVGLADGGFALAFIAGTAIGDRVHVQTFNADGTPRTPNPVPLFFSGHSTPAIAAMPNGNFAVVYDEGSYGEPGLTLSIVSPTGATLFNVRVDTVGASDESNPDVTVLPNGQILVTWENNTFADGDILGRLFSSTGVAVAVNFSTEPFVITISGSNDTAPSVAQIRQGVFVTSWTDSLSDGSGGSITTEVNEIVSTLTSDGQSDTLVASGIRDVIVGNGGNDTVSYQSSTAGVTVNLLAGPGTRGFAHGDTYSGIENITGSNFGDTLRGNAVANTLRGLGGNDTLDGGVGSDHLIGGLGNDIYIVNAGDNITETAGQGTDRARAAATFALAAGDDIQFLETTSATATGAINLTGNALAQSIFGNAGANTLNGGLGNDRLYGRVGNDKLNGDAGNDTLYGDVGTDTLTGGLGTDVLFGQTGADRFDFNLTSESVRGASRDRIRDFSRAQGDKIDLSTIDADTDGTAGNQAFTFIGTAAFSGVDGQLRCSGGIIQGDVNGDRVADFEIGINLATLLSTDFFR
ncbi:MAG TPA: calcium-binding protein [Rhizobiaceae bacterium]|nr:calcium-binding protein [Rhizobiaceae bacterium]